jgi:hypothetical protein
MNLFNLLKDITCSYKKLDKSKLPSQGLFYNDDFSIKIKKVNPDDISKYESEFIKDDLAIVINKVKQIVENNIILSDGYIFDDLKSIDIVFIFLEIVKHTKKRDITINYVDELKNKIEEITFDSKTFNYFILDEKLKKMYNKETKSFDIGGYNYTLPSIGVENCITYFLVMKLYEENEEKYENLNFNFSYFLAQKNFLTFDEIENLIEIFNFDLDEDEKNKIEKIIETFKPLQRYSLIRDGREVDINSKIDLENIWK